MQVNQTTSLLTESMLPKQQQMLQADLHHQLPTSEPMELPMELHHLLLTMQQQDSTLLQLEQLDLHIVPLVSVVNTVLLTLPHRLPTVV